MDGADSLDAGVGRGLSALLLLADGRFPAGGHAHSAGLEPAVALEGVKDVTVLEEFLVGRLSTAGLVAAAFAARACSTFHQYGGVGATVASQFELLDEELTARTPSPALRAVSGRLGRQVLRVGRTVWPHPGLDTLAQAPKRAPHHPVAFGAVAASAGLDPEAVAGAVAHDAVIGPATAAVRLLALDPFAVHATLARLGPRIDAIAAEAAGYVHGPVAELPASSGPLAEIGAEHHAVWERRLFAS